MHQIKLNVLLKQKDLLIWATIGWTSGIGLEKFLVFKKLIVC